jgi:hypothetical protein
MYYLSDKFISGTHPILHESLSHLKGMFITNLNNYKIIIFTLDTIIATRNSTENLIAKFESLENDLKDRSLKIAIDESNEQIHLSLIYEDLCRESFIALYRILKAREDGDLVSMTDLLDYYNSSTSEVSKKEPNELDSELKEFLESEFYNEVESRYDSIQEYQSTQINTEIYLNVLAEIFQESFEELQRLLYPPGSDSIYSIDNVLSISNEEIVDMSQKIAEAESYIGILEIVARDSFNEIISKMKHLNYMLEHEEDHWAELLERVYEEKSTFHQTAESTNNDLQEMKLQELEAFALILEYTHLQLVDINNEKSDADTFIKPTRISHIGSDHILSASFTSPDIHESHYETANNISAANELNDISSETDQTASSVGSRESFYLNETPVINSDFAIIPKSKSIREINAILGCESLQKKESRIRELEEYIPIIEEMCRKSFSTLIQLTSKIEGRELDENEEWIQLLDERYEHESKGLESKDEMEDSEDATLKELETFSKMLDTIYVEIMDSIATLGLESSNTNLRDTGTLPLSRKSSKTSQSMALSSETNTNNLITKIESVNIQIIEPEMTQNTGAEEPVVVEKRQSSFISEDRRERLGLTEIEIYINTLEAICKSTFTMLLEMAKTSQTNEFGDIDPDEGWEQLLEERYMEIYGLDSQSCEEISKSQDLRDYESFLCGIYRDLYATISSGNTDSNMVDDFDGIKSSEGDVNVDSSNNDTIMKLNQTLLKYQQESHVDKLKNVILEKELRNATFQINFNALSNNHNGVNLSTFKDHSKILVGLERVISHLREFLKLVPESMQKIVTIKSEVSRITRLGMLEELSNYLSLFENNIKFAMDELGEVNREIIGLEYQTVSSHSSIGALVSNPELDKLVEVYADKKTSNSASISKYRPEYQEF